MVLILGKITKLSPIFQRFITTITTTTTTITTTATNDTTKNHDTLSGNVPQAKIELTLVFIYLHLDKLILDQVSNNFIWKEKENEYLKEIWLRDNPFTFFVSFFSYLIGT